MIEVHWQILGNFPEDDSWNWCRVLYAYLHPTTNEILYIGKADRIQRLGKDGAEVEKMDFGLI